MNATPPIRPEPGATTRRERRGRPVTLNGRTLITHGLPYSYVHDFYHSAMTASWPLFTLATGLAFLVVNFVFALLFALGDDPIANAKKGDLLDLFYFSWETLATVGYGDMHPQTHYGHFVSSLESFVGLFGVAVMTGLIFSRFSRPRARLVFSRVAVVHTHEGEPTLSMRVANARQNMISNANAKLWLVRRDVLPEGVSYRRFYEMGLQRTENPVFALSWSIFHRIDAASPIFGLSPADLVAIEAQFLLTLTGHDEESVQVVHERRFYAPEDVCWGHRFAEIFVPATPGVAGGLTQIDYGRFHDTAAEPVAPRSGASS